MIDLAVAEPPWLHEIPITLKLLVAVALGLTGWVGIAVACAWLWAALR